MLAYNSSGKLRVESVTEEDHMEDKVSFSVKVLETDSEQLYCVEFTLTSGSYIEYLQ